MIGLRSYIKHAEECFIRYPNTLKWVNKNLGGPHISAHFSAFGYHDEKLFLVFYILHQKEQNK